jgi:hypothetical protein
MDLVLARTFSAPFCAEARDGWSMHLLCGIKSSLVGPDAFFGTISSSAWIARFEAHVH